MNKYEQLGLWVEGKSVHRGSRTEGECCPDFSCCRPELLAPKDVREVFAAAYKLENEPVVMRMLMAFLGEALSGYKVHIAGLAESQLEIEG